MSRGTSGRGRGRGVLAVTSSGHTMLTSPLENVMYVKSIQPGSVDVPDYAATTIVYQQPDQRLGQTPNVHNYSSSPVISPLARKPQVKSVPVLAFF